MKNRYSALIAFCVLLTTAANVTAQVFSSPVPIVDYNSPTASASFGQYNSVAIVNGKPAISFYDRIHFNLCYVQAADSTGTNWNDIVVVDDIHNVGLHTSLCVVDGYPAITYYDASYQRLLYTRALDSNGVSWSAPVIIHDDWYPADMGQYSNLFIANGNPAVLYLDMSVMNIMYCRANDATGSSWSTPISLPVGSGNFTELKYCPSNGNPGLFYIETTTDQIFYISASDPNGNFWNSFYQVTGTGSSAEQLSACTVAGYPAVAFYDSFESSLKYRQATSYVGSSWLPTVILDSAGTVGMWPSIINTGSQVMIGYTQGNNVNFKIISSTNASASAWNSPVINPGTFNGVANLNLININGRPGAVYIDTLPLFKLHYALAIDPTATSWNSEYDYALTGSAGFYTTICEVGGTPAALSADRYGRVILYHKALDNYGQTWNPPVVIGSTYNMNPRPMDINIVNGYPAACWHDDSLIALVYRRALDSSGTSWGPPVLVLDTNAFYSPTIRLMEISGKPVIGFIDNYNGPSLIYANDSLGTSWGSQIICPVANNVYRANFEIINNRPALTYVETSPVVSRFIIATDSSGTSWLPPIMIDTINISYHPPALASANDKPAIVYRNQSSGVSILKLAQNSSGTIWNSDVVISPNPVRDLPLSIVTVHGRMVIGYVTPTNAQYCVRYANDSVGNNWSAALVADSMQGTATVPSPQFSVQQIANTLGIATYRRFEEMSFYSSACITPLPPHSAPAVNICENTSDTLFATGYGTLSWYDAPTGGNYLGSGSVFISPVITANTTFYVQDSTCAASSRTTVMIAARTAPQISASNDTSICPGESVTLSVSGANWYSWSTGDTVTSITVSPNVDSTFIVQGTGLNFCSDYDTITVSLYSPIDTAINYTSGVLTSAEPSAQYQWINCTTQQTIAGATSQNFTPTVNETYAVIINNGNCIDTSECYNVTDVGINGSSSTNVQLNAFYNSSNGRIEFNLMNSTGKVLYEIYNVNGAEVITLEKSGSEPGYFTPNAAGVYIIRATTSTGTTIQRVIAE
ncbi:MAG: T9SS type A sorting domain-containing protein [Bacteroidia bacterium]|nr:T9SS type A sorting domain-containing protein [Bacteroidia bacterium]